VYLQVDATFQANSGHPGAPMGMAPVAHVVWNKFMTFNPKNPEWINRDRFVLSYVLFALSTHTMAVKAIAGGGLRMQRVRKHFRRRRYRISAGHADAERIAFSVPACSRVGMVALQAQEHLRAHPSLCIDVAAMAHAPQDEEADFERPATVTAACSSMR
jgi:hypothetical protein